MAHKCVLNKFHPTSRMKLLLICLFWPAIFMNCSGDDPVKPPDEEPPPEGPMHKIVFSAKDSQGQYKLYTINDNGSELKEIFTNKAKIEDLWVSPTGDRVVCDANVVTPPSVNEQLFIVMLNGNGATQITRYQNGILEEPQWLPNGEEILFGRFEPYGAQIYRIRVDGSNLARVTIHDSISHRHPRLSPDGKKIAFETRGRPNKLWAMNIDGTNQVLLSASESDASAPEWTPDGKKIVYGIYPEFEVWIVDANGGNKQRLCNGMGSHNVSSNGKLAVGNYDGLYTINLDGSELQKLCSVRSNNYPILWSKDGSKIAFRGDTNGDGKDGICIIEANGTGLREVTDSRIEVESSPSRAFDWLP